MVSQSRSRVARQSVAILVCSLGFCTLTSVTFAQEVPLPSVIKFIVPVAPGAGTDLAARAIAQQLGPRLGKTVIVENKAGASTIIGVQAVMSGPHDGSTLLFTSSSIASTAATLRNFQYDVTKDLVPISVVSDGPMLVVVSTKSGIKTPADLVARARANPDALTAGSAGVSSIGHLAVELLNEAAKIHIRHIPYKGAAPAVLDVAAGNVDMYIGSNSAAASQLQTGRAIAIAVTSAQPSPAFPGLPTMASAAPGYSATIWYGLFAPAGTPSSVIQRLNREVNAIAKTPEFGKILQMDGAAPLNAGPEELQKFVRDDYAMWKKLAHDKNIIVE
jgi:tripartite-type tricarboxylate transporter receptor subunit TctC